MNAIGTRTAGVRGGGGGGKSSPVMASLDRITLLGIAASLLTAVVGCSKKDPGTGLTPTATIGEVGTSPGQFAFPRALDTDGESLWVIDKAGRVQRFELATGNCVEYWGMPETEFGKPTGVTVFPGEPPLLFVPDTHYQRVMVYAIEPLATVKKGPVTRPTPEPITRFGRRGKGPGEFIYPTDIAILPTEDGKKPARLYIAEYGDNDRVSVYEPDGAGAFAFKFSFGHWGTGDGRGNGESSERHEIEFNRPQSISLDMGVRELIVADAGNHRIGRFTLEGKLVKWIGSPDAVGEEPGHFRYPWALSAMGDGTALVVEQASARVQRIDLSTGQSLGIFGAPGAGPGHLATPWAIALSHGMMYIADGANNRVIAAKAPPERPVAVAKHGGGS